MKLINIPSVRNVDYCLAEPMFMALAHLVKKDEAYKQWLQNYEGYLILDNSVIETKKAVSIEELVDFANEIYADEIILPDVFGNAESTITLVKKALAYVGVNYPGRFSIMAVLQGKTIDELKRCLDFYLTQPLIDVIGIPKNLDNFEGVYNRASLEELWLEAAEHKKIHLLGCWNTLTELLNYKHPDIIRSCDTSMINCIIEQQMPVGGIRPTGYTVDLENFYATPEEWFRTVAEIKEVIRV